jgi:hypothetical protein
MRNAESRTNGKRIRGDSPVPLRPAAALRAWAVAPASPRLRRAMAHKMADRSGYGGQARKPAPRSRPCRDSGRPEPRRAGVEGRIAEPEMNGDGMT